MNWYRQYHDDLDDGAFSKAGIAAEEPEDLPLWGLWFYLNCRASRARDRGTVPNLADYDEAAGFCRRHGGTPARVQAMYSAFVDAGLVVDGRIRDWDKTQRPAAKQMTAEEQLEKIRAGNRERQQRFRDRKAAAAGKGGKGSSAPQPAAQAPSAGWNAPAPRPAAEAPSGMPEPGKPAPAPDDRGRDIAAADAGAPARRGNKAPAWAYAAWEKIEPAFWARNSMYKAKDAWIRRCAAGIVKEGELPCVLRGLERMEQEKPLRDNAGIAMPDPAEWIGGLNWRDDKLNDGWSAELSLWERRAGEAMARKAGTPAGGQARTPQTFDQKRRESNATAAVKSARRVADMQMQMFFPRGTPDRDRVQVSGDGAPAEGFLPGLDAPEKAPEAVPAAG